MLKFLISEIFAEKKLFIYFHELNHKKKWPKKLNLLETNDDENHLYKIFKHSRQRNSLKSLPNHPNGELKITVSGISCFHQANLVAD